MKRADMSDPAKTAAEIMAKVRTRRPLVHHITNFVVMNITANITLCAGALPVMAHAKEEAAEMTSGAGALVLNLGTLGRTRSRPCSRRVVAPTNAAYRLFWIR